MIGHQLTRFIDDHQNTHHIESKTHGWMHSIWLSNRNSTTLPQLGQHTLFPSTIPTFTLFPGPHLPGRGRHWNFDPLQCLGPRPEILDRYISLSCLRWLPTACHERLAYFHWPQWVTWLVTWWVTWSRSPDASRHIGKFSLWTTLLRFSRSAQISLFSNFTKLGQLFFDNIFFGLTS